MRLRHLLPPLAAAASWPASAAEWWTGGMPMSYLRTFGAAGDPATRLGWGLGIVSLVVMVVIGLLLLVGVARRRPPPRHAGELAVARDEGGLSWIYVGVGISSVVLAACAVWTMFTLSAVAMPPKPGLVVRVTAHQWWWELRYESEQPSRTFTTANELHVPVGVPVRLELQSPDVIHSLWVPQLVGKTDLIPGQSNAMWLQADRAGVYRGQCGEYCGAQHAHMAFAVVAEEPAMFQAWLGAQQLASTDPPSPAAQRGHELFVQRCAACHQVRGGDAGGIVGPDLTHLKSRRTIAAGLLSNTPGNLAAWVENAQVLKPGCNMPAMALSGAELNAIVAYLDTLQ